MHGIQEVEIDKAIHRLHDCYKNRIFCNKTIDMVLSNLVSSHIGLPPKPPIIGAAFKGGGVKVLAHIGALLAQDAYDKGGIDRLKYVAGSSGGGILAFLIAMGFSATQIFEFVNHVKLTDFLDADPSKKQIKFASFPWGNVVDFVKSGYIYSGENFRNWASAIIEFVLGSKDATFLDLHNTIKLNPALKDLYIVTTRLQPQADQSREVVFSYDRYPDALIIDALCASIALPTIFPPVWVRQKDKPGLGYFTDGGILNNFPNSVFDSDKFCDPSYPLQSNQYKDYAESSMINPSILGFSIVSHVDQLDANITPYSERIKAITQNAPKNKKTTVALQPHWTISDYFPILWRYKYGKLQPEDSQRKYRTHPANTVQIYIEKVNTTEFHLDDDKFHLLIESGYNAASMWHAKFRDPKDFYSGTFQNEPKNNQIANQQDKKTFYIEKLAHHFVNWMQDLQKFKKNSARELKHFISIQYNSFLVSQLFQKIYSKFSENESHDIVAVAWYNAAEYSMSRKKAVEASRSNLNIFIYPNLMLKKLKELLDAETSEELFQILIKSQPQYLLSFLREEHNNLLQLVLKKNIKLLSFLFSQIKLSCEQFPSLHDPVSYYNVVNTFPKYPLLFEANIISMKAIQICLNAGCDPCYKHNNGKTAIHHAIDIGNASALFEYLAYIRKHKIDLNTIRFGFHQVPLWHYIIESQNEVFLKILLEQHGAHNLEFLYSNTQIDRAGVTFLEKLAQKGVHVWRLGMDYFVSPSKEKFTDVKNRVIEKKREYLQRLKQLRQDIVSSEKGMESKLKKLTIQDLLALLDPALDQENEAEIKQNLKTFYSLGSAILVDAGLQNEVNLLELKHVMHSADEPILFATRTFKKSDKIKSKTLSYIAQFGSAEDFFKKIIKYRANLVNIKLKTSTPEEADEKSPFHFLIDHKRGDIFKFLKERFEKQERKLYFDDLFDLSSEGALWAYAHEQDPELASYLLEYTRNEYSDQFKIVNLTTTVNHLKLL